MTYTDQQVDAIIRSMASGIHGGFASALADAYAVADSTNQDIILKSFSALISKVARFIDIVPAFDEAKHEAFIERRMSMLDKKLMQGHISQEDYDIQASQLNNSIPF